MNEQQPDRSLEDFLARQKAEQPTINVGEPLPYVPKPSVTSQWKSSQARYAAAVSMPVIVIVVLIGLRILRMLLMH